MGCYTSSNNNYNYKKFVELLTLSPISKIKDELYIDYVYKLVYYLHSKHIENEDKSFSINNKFINNKTYNFNINFITNNISLKYSNIDVQKTLDYYIKDLVDIVYDNVIFIKLRNHRDSSNFINNNDLELEYKNKISNEYFNYTKLKITKLFNNTNDESYSVYKDILIHIIFYSINNYKTISSCLSKLYNLLYNKSILRREGNLFYINMKKISNPIKLYVNSVSFDAIYYVKMLVNTKLSIVEFVEYYNKIYSLDTLNIYYEAYLDYNFIEEASLAFFIKVIYPSFSQYNNLYKILYDFYLKNKVELESYKRKIQLDHIERELMYLNNKIDNENIDKGKNLDSNINNFINNISNNDCDLKNIQLD